MPNKPSNIQNEQRHVHHELVKMLACPVDQGVLWYFVDEHSLYNSRKKLRYRIEDGIPIMLVEEADKVDDAEHERLKAKAASLNI